MDLFSLLVLAGIYAASWSSVPPAGGVVVSFEDKTAIMTAAPADGVYSLYVGDEDRPSARFTLKQGDPIGFRNQDGGTFAVAGATKLPVSSDPPAALRWKSEKPE